MASPPPAAPRRHTAALRRRAATVLLLVLLLLGGLVPSAAAAGGDRAPAPAGGVWPLQPAPPVVAGFDPPAERWLAGHRGVDLLGGAGRPVHTALAGTVTFAGPLAGIGVVVVDHGGFRTTYQPVAASVRVGDVVSAGEVLGRLEMAGSHCLPQACLHWGLRRGDAYEDPLTLVGAGPVRLLPLDGLPLAAGGTGAASSIVGPMTVVPVGPVGAALRSWRPLRRLASPLDAGDGPPAAWSSGAAGPARPSGAAALFRGPA